MAPVDLSPLATAYDHVLLDLDGCVWVGDAAVPGAPEALAAVRAAGKGIAFVTNDPRHTPEDYVRKLWRLGFQASLAEVVTVGAAVQFLLAGSSRSRTAYVIGSPAMIAHVAAAGLRVVNGTDLAARAEVVVVAGHDGFHYAELRTAVQAVLRGADLIGTTRDATFPMPDGLWPGTGPILAAVKVGAGRPADLIVGKPQPSMYAVALDRLGPGRVLAVGDRLDMDVAGAQRAGLDSALVLTGASRHEDALDSQAPPTHVAPSLTQLLLGARRARPK
jgi:HAD superfamily hydrolase (TIGR01450 family)